MKKRLRTMGNSWGFVITKTMLEYMEINPAKDEVEIVLENKSITIKKYPKDKT